MSAQETMYFSIADEALARVDELLRGAPDCRPFPPSPELRPLLEVLRMRLGRSNAIKAEDLARRVHSNRRKVLDLVSELRRTYGVKIGTDRSSTGGLYLIQTQQEWDETVRQLRHDFSTLARTVSGMCGKRETAEMLGQLRAQFSDEEVA